MAGCEGSGRSVRLVAVVVTMAVFAAACGGGGGSSKTAQPTTTPREGGTIVYGLDAETTGGWCPKNAQLAASGIIENEAVYDPLTIPNDKGQVVPYLAQSVTPSPDYSVWTITLRPGITFHDGEPLDAAAVKLNLDTVRSGPLGGFVLANLKTVTVAGPLTVTVTMFKPWIAFPLYLYATGRGGIAAPKQIASPDCASDLIGTGPFMLKQWVPNDHMTVVKNPHYWHKDTAGRPLPYLDQIEFRPIVDTTARLNALKTGQIQVMLTDNGDTIAQIRQAANAGQLAEVENQNSAEIEYTMLRVDKGPFDDLTARQAVAYATDRHEINQLIYHGVLTETNTPFAPDVFAYLKEPVSPPVTFDLNRARQLVEQYKAAHGGRFAFTLSSVNDPTIIREAQLVQSQWQKAGMDVTLRQADQATLINQGLGGDFQAVLWRNHPGGDPDGQYVWWHSASPVNFNNINDPQIDKDFDQARSATDPNVRKADYQDLQRQLAKQLYSLWGFYALWAFASKPTIHGLTGPDLPDGGRPGLVASVHPVVGIWAS
jgi:peptide/nickel transport system substrate-binding protein